MSFLGLLLRFPIVSLQDLIPVLARDSVLFLEFAYVLTFLAMSFRFRHNLVLRLWSSGSPKRKGPYFTYSFLGYMEKTYTC